MNEGTSQAAPAKSALEDVKQKLIRLIEENGDAEVQVEASRLIICANLLTDPPAAGDIALLETGIAALSGREHNVRVAKFVRNQLEIDRRNRGRGPLPWLSRKLGDSAVYAMMVGAVASAIVWAIAFVAVLLIGGKINEWFGTEFIMPPVETKPLAFAAAVGGIVSLLSRVNQFASLYVFDPVLIFVNSLLKPLLGCLLALTAYAILKSGLIQISGLTLESSGPYRFIFWAFGFVAGFSERLAGDFIARAEIVIGRPGETRPPARAPSADHDAG